MKSSSEMTNDISAEMLDQKELKRLSADVHQLKAPQRKTVPWWNLLRRWNLSLLPRRDSAPVHLWIRLRIGSDKHFSIKLFGIEVHFVGFTNFQQRARSLEGDKVAQLAERRKARID